ncbi:uncharacterized protein LOC142634568 [Castanea sativa]|uniref:uncharacterized protein LOC142634568 n=1 Tax=Castanea sativa TaxID=21020 RepID=UPI003F6540AA
MELLDRLGIALGQLMPNSWRIMVSCMGIWLAATDRVKRRPKLKSRYKERVEKAIEYAKTIEDWDDRVDPRTLSFYCFSLEPPASVLHNLDIEGKKRKKKMTTKFDKDLYAKMRSKKDEPLSSLGKRTVRVTRKGPSVTPTVSGTPIVSGTETTRTASPATSIEEIPTPASKRPRLSDKGKEKADFGSSTVWDNERLAVERAHRVVTTEDFKVFFGVPFNEVATHHVHKLVQVLGESIHITFEYLTQGAMVASLVSRMEALEAENSTLKKKLIDSMGESTTLKEKIKTLSDNLRAECQLTLEKDEQLLGARERIKTIATNVVEAFQ